MSSLNLMKLSITVPVDDTPDSPSEAGFCTSPVRARLESYRTSPPHRRSPEEMDKALAEATERARALVEAKKSTAAEYNARVHIAAERRSEAETEHKVRTAERLTAALDRASRKRSSLEERRRAKVQHRQEAFYASREHKARQREERANDERRRCDEADKKRARLLNERVERSSQAVKKALELATARKGSREPTELEKALLGAGVPASPGRLAASGPRELDDASSSSECAAARILSQMAVFGAESDDFDFERLSVWMRSVETIDAMAECLGRAGVRAAAAPRLALALVCMRLDSERLFTESREDKLMGREAARFVRALEAELKAQADEAGGAPAPDAGARAERFGASFTRARRFHRAWSTADRPATLDFLLSSVVALKAKQTRDGGVAEPPEDLFAQIRALGGDDAEAEARRRYDGAWAPVAQQDMATTVAEIAHRAFWDSVQEGVSNGNLDPLFSVLGELQGAMRALVAHRPDAVAELDDKFDAEWLKQRAENDALDLSDVHNLVRYVIAAIADWQAPVDDAETRAWITHVETILAATQRAPLLEFIGAHLVGIVRGAIDKVGQVYKRLMALAEERREELERAVAGEDGEMAQQD